MKKQELSSPPDSRSLGRKLVYLKQHLHRGIRGQPAGDSPRIQSSSAADVACGTATGKPTSPFSAAARQESLEHLGSSWEEPPSSPVPLHQPRRDWLRSHFSPARTAQDAANTTPNAETIAQPAQSDSAPETRHLTRPRHLPTPTTRPNKPNSPPPDVKIVVGLVEGGSRMLKPLRREARIERNRFIFFCLLCAVLLIIIWAMTTR